MTDPGSQRSKRMPQNCPAEKTDEKPSRRQFVDLKLIDHGNMSNRNKTKTNNILARKKKLFHWKAIVSCFELKNIFLNILIIQFEISIYNEIVHF